MILTLARGRARKGYIGPLLCNYVNFSATVAASTVILNHYVHKLLHCELQGTMNYCSFNLKSVWFSCNLDDRGV